MTDEKTRTHNVTTTHKIITGLMDLLTQIPESKTKKSETPSLVCKEIIRSASLKAAGISGALALPPGPLGLLTVLPDLFAIWRLQAQMVADIAAAHGKTGFLTKEALLYCLFKHGASQLLRDVVVRSGERFILRRSSHRMIENICQKLGIKVSQRVLGASVSRWLPVLGAVVVGSYARYDTQQVGAFALDFFSKDIETAPEVIDVAPVS